MKKIKLFAIISLLLIFTELVWGEDILRISTTTSVDNSGLLSVLHPFFQKKYQIRLDVIAVGSGKALKIASHGDVDVVLVHAPDTELKYFAQGDFISRSAVMSNDFVLLGPINDPAGVASAKTVLEALVKIFTSQSVFVSRGDDSGTHKKELKLWQELNIEPKGVWYISAGQGMGAVLQIADAKQAYTLVDRGTQIAFSDKISLGVVFENDPALFNPYHVMAVNPEKHPYINNELAQKYIDFLLSAEGQQRIVSYKKAGQQLFYPNVKNKLTID